MNKVTDDDLGDCKRLVFVFFDFVLNIRNYENN